MIEKKLTKKEILRWIRLDLRNAEKRQELAKEAVRLLKMKKEELESAIKRGEA